MRIALLTYRGNMFCGGQGIYAAYVARELHRLGHEVHVIAGPPLPDLEPGIPLHVIPNENFFAQPMAEALPADNPFRALFPTHLWELALTRLGVFPEMTAFSLRLLARWRGLMRRYRFDVVLDNQSLGWGLLGIQATGVPVVGMVHHPLHIDRIADFETDPRFRRKWKRTLYFPMLMQEQVVPRLARIMTVSHASAREDDGGGWARRHDDDQGERPATGYNTRRATTSDGAVDCRTAGGLACAPASVPPPTPSASPHQLTSI